MNTKIDGRELAAQEYILLKEGFDVIHSPKFNIVYLGEDPVIDNFIRYKKNAGKKLGVNVAVHQIVDPTQKEAEELVSALRESEVPMIIQLPVPENINSKILLDMVPQNLDVDVLASASITNFVSSGNDMVPAVPGAIMMSFLSVFNFEQLREMNIVIVGFGALVGKAFADYLKRYSIEYDLIDINTDLSKKAELLGNADLVVSGVGSPSLIKKSELKEGVVLIDAGTSEVSKKIVGDIDPDAYVKASYYTPVPGGIGPLTIVQLYKNILYYYKHA